MKRFAVILLIALGGAAGFVRWLDLVNYTDPSTGFVLVGSVRDDGPLPEVYHDVYAGQDDMRSHVKQATTVIGMATTLHTIATGNLTPSYHVEKDGNIRPVYFYSVDTSDFSANKLADRGSLSAKGIVANAQDFITKIAAGLGL